jgi:hypothetical protein
MGGHNVKRLLVKKKTTLFGSERFKEFTQVGDLERKNPNIFSFLFYPFLFNYHIFNFSIVMSSLKYIVS